jgi:hypothetical protein
LHFELLKAMSTENFSVLFFCIIRSLLSNEGNKTLLCGKKEWFMSTFLALATAGSISFVLGDQLSAHSFGVALALICFFITFIYSKRYFDDLVP